MSNSLTGCEEEHGFHLRKRQSRRVPRIIITDMDFADDIALVSDGIRKQRSC